MEFYYTRNCVSISDSHHSKAIRSPRATYFEQAKNGVYIRMALILLMLGNGNGQALLKGKCHTGVKCKNPKCITNSEDYLPKSFIGNGDTLECEYCDERLLMR